MLLKKGQIIEIGTIIKSIEERGDDISVATKYKLLKLENLISEDFDIFNRLIDEAILKYCDKDENKKPIFLESGKVQISGENAVKLQNEIDEFTNMPIEICDYYFSLSELECLNLSWKELKAFMPFIK